MCVVSMIAEQYPRQFPNWPINTLPLQEAIDLKEILRRLDALDKKLGAINCPEDAPKREFFEALDNRIAELEKAVKGRKSSRRKAKVKPKQGKAKA